MFLRILLMEGIPYTGSVEGRIIYHLWCWPNTCGAFRDVGSGERACRQKRGWVPMVSYVWVLLSFSGLPWDVIHGILTFLYSFNRSFSDDSEWCIHEPFWWSVSMWLAASYVFYSTSAFNSPSTNISKSSPTHGMSALYKYALPLEGSPVVLPHLLSRR